MRAPSPPCDRLDLAHPWLTGLSLSLPIDYDPVLLRRTLQIPSCDGHPALRGTTSGEPKAGAVALVSRWLLAGLSLRRLSPVWHGSVSCFCSSNNLLHFLGQRGITPVFGYGAPHLSARGT